MLATQLLRDISGGVIPRAKEVVGDGDGLREGVPSGDWEMVLKPKEEREWERRKIVDFEVKLPRHNFQDDKERARLTTAPL